VPGTVFAFADERVSGRIYGGRITEYNAGIKAVTTDRGTSAVAGDTLLIRTQGGTVESRVIQAVNGTQLIVSTPFKAAPLPNAIFVIDAGQLRLQYFRVTNLTFNDEENTFTITGAEYNASKYDAVDNNARLDTPPISLIPTGLVAQPQNVVITSYDSVRQGQRIATLVASWDPPLDKNGKPQADIVSYRVQWKRGENEWINVPATGLRNIEVPGIFEGDYLVRVCAINSGGASSLWASSTLTHLSGRIGAVPKPVGLIATPINWGIQLNWAFPAGSEDTLQTEVQYSASSTGNNPMLLAGVPYPQHSYTQAGLRAGQEFWYRARLVDRIGNQSDWTDWVRGMANDQASDYLDAIKGEVLLAADGKALTEKIDFSIAGVLQGTLANIQGAKVSFEQFGIARAEISQAQELIADAKQSYAEFKDLVAVQFGDSAAEILTVRKAQATTDSAMALLTTTVQATTQSVDALTGRVIHAEASVVSISEAQTNNEQALATFEQQATAKFTAQDQQFGEQMAAINQKFTAYADATSANAIYALKAGVQYNGNYYNAGISVAVIANGSSVSTRVAINANELVMLSGSSTSQMYSPFAIVSGQVFLNDAFIQKGSIGNLQIGNYIQSNDWDGSGNVGWHVNKSGYATFNGVTVRGTVYATDGEFTGKINATSGSFKGSVEADSFIGDVANGQVFPDTGISSTVSVAFTYTDSGTQLRDKHIVLMAMISVGGATGPGATGGAADVTLSIGNVSKTYRVVNATDRGPLFTTLMVSARVRARSVACSITGKTGGISSGGSCQILSPSVIVARGSGAFEQTS